MAHAACGTEPAPEDGDAWAALGACLESQGHWYAASEAWYRGWEATPDVPGALEAQLRLSPHVADHARLAATAIAADPAGLSPEALGYVLLAEGDALSAAGDIAAAGERYGKVAASSAAWFLAQYRLVPSLAAEGKWKSTVMAYREVMRASPEPPSLPVENLKDAGLVGIGYAYIQSGGPDEKAASYVAMMQRHSPFASVGALVGAQGLWLAEDAKGARKELGRVRGDAFIPEAMALRVFLASDPERARKDLERESKEWGIARAELESLAAAERAVPLYWRADSPRAQSAFDDLRGVWSIGQMRWTLLELGAERTAAGGDPVVEGLLDDRVAELKAQISDRDRVALRERIDRIDAALAAANDALAGGALEPLAWTTTDYGD